MTADLPVDPMRSKIMRSVRQKKTKPEMLVRRALHGLGYRYKTNVRGLPGSPDIVFSARQKAIFVHGCFWHRHSGCRLASMPKTRKDFWIEKFNRNVARDAEKIRELEAMGWEAITIWECETRNMEKLLPTVVDFLGPSLYGFNVAR